MRLAILVATLALVADAALVTAPASALLPPGDPFGSVDVIGGFPDGAHVEGWVIDPDTTSPTHVAIYVDGVGFGSFLANGSRPDVNAAFGYGANHGFDLVVPLASGTHQVCVFGIDIGVGSNQLMRCASVAKPSGTPFGSVDTIMGTPDGAQLAGWVIDPDTFAPAPIAVYIDGVGFGTFLANTSRPDVNAAFGYGANHGFGLTVPLSSGTHQVCVFGINSGAGSNHLMRCANIAKPTGKPFGSVDVIDGIVDGARVAGWVIDPDTFAPIQIAVYIDGVGFGTFLADTSRPDVNAAFGYGANHGFDLTVPLEPGLHEVCVFGLNVGVGSNHLMRCAEVAPDVIPPTLTDSVYLSGLNRPWDMGFAPDGTLVVTEKPGDVHAFVGGELRLIAHPADVALVGEGGMMGVAVDPEFETNRYIYTCYQSNASGALDVRVVRWTVNGDYTGTTQRSDILTGIPVNNVESTGRHVGCRTRFGPDGFLWITTGDAAIGTNPQNPQSLGGKVLRVDRNGNGAPGNPGGAFRPEIYTKGHRNVQGIAFRPSDGAAFVIEHGSTRDDEVNLLVPGGNYGWDPVPGYDESTPMTDLGKFPNAQRPVWSSGFPTIAPSGGTFLEGAQWGDWGANPVLVMAVLKGSHLRVLSIDQENDKLYNELAVFNTQGRLRTAVQGPDGMLYVSQDAAPGSIFRIAPAP